MDRSRCAGTRHGDWQAYVGHQCRCKDARLSWGRYKLAVQNGTYVSKVVDATGTCRRIRGLVAMGHSLASQARHMGMSAHFMNYILRQKKVLKSTADRVKAMTRTLGEQPPPQGRWADQARATAVTRGWIHLWDWDEHAIDNPSAPIPGTRGAKDLPQRFCKHGHDTFQVGRNRRGWCRVCERASDAARRAAA